MIVMKFGGTSLGDAATIAEAAAIVRAHRHRDPLVVVSAHAGVTDALAQLVPRVAAGQGDTAVIAERHRALLGALGLRQDLLDPLLGELEDVLRSVRLVGAALPRIADHALSFGERCSARVFAAALTAAGVPAVAFDAWDLGLRTDAAFGRARPLPDDGRIAAAVAQCAGVPVVTGFVGKDGDGNVTTLGRNGSDLSAAWFGAALGAAEIQIWKDVDGVRTADPRLVPDAQPVPEMTFDEASELSAFGSKVLHPAALAPACFAGIPVTVRSTRAPDQPGTRIVAATPEREPRVRAIAHRGGTALLTVAAQRILPQHAFLAHAATALAAAGIDAPQLWPSAGALTLLVAAADAAAAATALAPVGDVQVERGTALVGVVGDVPALAAGGAARVLDALARAGVAVRRCGTGARGSTFAVAVGEPDAERAVRALHDAFFAAPAAGQGHWSRSR